MTAKLPNRVGKSLNQGSCPAFDVDGETSELEKVISRLSEVESMLDKLVAEASKAGRELVITAEREAESLKARLVAETEALMDRLLAETRAAAEAKAREITEKAEREAAEVRERAERNIGEAVAFAVSALLGEA
jgi:vacuolar-type H+-ATPase subunit H